MSELFPYPVCATSARLKAFADSVLPGLYKSGKIVINDANLIDFVEYVVINFPLHDVNFMYKIYVYMTNPAEPITNEHWMKVVKAYVAVMSSDFCFADYVHNKRRAYRFDKACESIADHV
jgi:hypothetical protein